MTKRALVVLLIIAALLCTAAAIAEEYKPGDKVKVTVTVEDNSVEAWSCSAQVGYDSSVMSVKTAKVLFINIPNDLIAEGEKKTLTFTISEDAKPGTYSFTVTEVEAADETKAPISGVKYSVSPSSITIAGGEEPTTEAPTTEKPTTEAPTTEKPTTEAPTTEKPTTEAPTTEKPTTEKPTTEKPTTEKPTTEKPTTEKPTTEKPTTEAVVKYSMTACSLGLRFRDVSKLTKNWDMFTPVDLSKDGEQTFDLIAGNMHVIGKVKLTVKEGKVTVSVKTNSVDIAKKGEFLTFLPSLAETETLDQSKLTAYKFDEEIDIEKDLGGDTNVLLYILNRYYYTSETKGVERFFPNGGAYKKLAETLKEGLE